LEKFLCEDEIGDEAGELSPGAADAGSEGTGVLIAKGDTEGAERMLRDAADRVMGVDAGAGYTTPVSDAVAKGGNRGSGATLIALDEATLGWNAVDDGEQVANKDADLPALTGGSSAASSPADDAAAEKTQGAPARELSGILLRTVSRQSSKSRASDGGKKIAYEDRASKKERNVVLKNVIFEFKRGSVYSVMGRIGSGKSTLLSSFLRETQLFGGDVRIEEGLKKAYVSQTPWIRNCSLYDSCGTFVFCSFHFDRKLNWSAPWFSIVSEFNLNKSNVMALSRTRDKYWHFLGRGD
jgi:hypothetical protein